MLGVETRFEWLHESSPGPMNLPAEFDKDRNKKESSLTAAHIRYMYIVVKQNKSALVGLGIRTESCLAV